MSEPQTINPADVTFSTDPVEPFEFINPSVTPNDGLDFPKENTPTITITNKDKPETVTSISIPPISNVEKFTVVFECKYLLKLYFLSCHHLKEPNVLSNDHIDTRPSYIDHILGRF